MLLRIDNFLQGNAELGERDVDCNDTDRLTVVSVYGFGDDNAGIDIEVCSSRDSYIKNRAMGSARLLYNILWREFRDYS